MLQGAEDDDRTQTVYTLRLRTGFGRDAGIRAPAAGVLVCLVGKDGAACLQRVGPLYDAESTERELQAICQACSSTLAALTHTVILIRLTSWTHAALTIGALAKHELCRQGHVAAGEAQRARRLISNCTPAHSGAFLHMTCYGADEILTVAVTVSQRVCACNTSCVPLPAEPA